jgi:hypothetical protein
MIRCALIGPSTGDDRGRLNGAGPYADFLVCAGFGFGAPGAGPFGTAGNFDTGVLGGWYPPFFSKPEPVIALCSVL